MIYIYEVHYEKNDSSRFIAEVHYYDDVNKIWDKLTKDDVIKLIDVEHKTVKTMYKRDNKFWAGKEVHSYGGKYISTDPNNKKIDNLENIPEY